MSAPELEFDELREEMKIMGSREYSGRDWRRRMEVLSLFSIHFSTKQGGWRLGVSFMGNLLLGRFSFNRSDLRSIEV